jgi:hypothetical protein
MTQSQDSGDAAARGLLALWTAITGRDLSSDQRRRFLIHPAVPQLVLHPLTALTAAAGVVVRDGRVRLTQWLEQIEKPLDLPPAPPTSSRHPAAAPAPSVARTPTPVRQSQRREPAPRSRTQRSALRSPDKLVPQRPVDWELAKKIGPVQQYDDTF